MLAPAFLTAAWRDLVVVSWSADAELLAPRVPRGVVLDTWDGRALVSLVGFRFIDTRVLGVPVPGHRAFPEVNLRTYVRREADDGARRGVVFLRELVPKRAIAWLARASYGEPYLTLPMAEDVSRDEAAVRAAYSWSVEGSWCRLFGEAEGRAQRPAAGTREAFVTERPWGYSRSAGGRTLEYSVAREPWTFRAARASGLEATPESLAAIFGSDLAVVLGGDPVSSILVDGSPVRVRWRRALSGT